MTGNSRKILKCFTDQITKSPLLHNASTLVGNATDRAQEKIFNLQRIASKKYVSIIKQVNSSAIVQDSIIDVSQPSPLPKRLVNYWQWYQQLIGMDKVEFAKQQVITVQDKLFKCQDERRLLTRQATSISEKLKDIYSELIQTKRDDPKYVQLTILENKGLQEQIRLNIQLNHLENEERDHFTQLATAIKEYHDSQAMNAQKYKYISILASALLAVVSLTGSIFYNNKKITDIRNVIAGAQNSIENNFNEKFIIIMKKIESHENIMTSGFSISKLPNISVSQPENIIDKNNIISQDNLTQNIEKVKYPAYYLGIVICSMYFLQQIFKN